MASSSRHTQAHILLYSVCGCARSGQDHTAIYIMNPEQIEQCYCINLVMLKQSQSVAISTLIDDISTEGTDLGGKRSASES